MKSRIKIALILSGIFTSLTSFPSMAVPPALTGLAVTPGTLSPSFNGAILNYTLQLTPNDSGVTFTPQATGSTISVNGTPFASSGIAVFTPAGRTTPILISSVAGDVTINYLINVVHNVGLTPTFSGKITTDGVFTFNISNFDNSYTWSATSSLGNASVDANGKVTVIGIPQGSSGTVTVTSSKDDYSPKSAVIVSDVIPVVTKTALTPTFSVPVPNATGYTVNFTNYDSSFNLVIKTNLGQVSSGVANGNVLPITVTGLTTGQSAIVTITTSRTGYYSGTGTVTGSTLPGTGLTPLVSTSSGTTNGFTFNITNYDSAYTYNISTTPGTVLKGSASGSILPVTISNLMAGQSANVTITVTRAGFTTTTANVSGSAITGAALNPTFSNPNANSSGFTVTITNYDSKFTYTASTTLGTATISSGGLVTVSGVSAGNSSTVTIKTSRTGFNNGTSSVTGSAAQGLSRNPTFMTVNSTQDGFTVQISNYDPTFQWAVTASSGSASINSTGLLTLTNLTAGTAATVTITTTKVGFAQGSSIIRGSAKPAPIPVPSMAPSSHPSIKPTSPSLISKKTPSKITPTVKPTRKKVKDKKPDGKHPMIITCSNGKITKRIVTFTPKCPTGYVRKG